MPFLLWGVDEVLSNVVQYGFDSDFDLQKHKKEFQHYLEVIVDKEGTVMYAVPSHQEKLIAMACEENGWSREQLMEACPARFHYDFITWLLMLTQAVSVWTEFCMAPTPSQEQIEALTELRNGGVYEGTIPPKVIAPIPKDELLAKEGKPLWELTIQTSF